MENIIIAQDEDESMDDVSMETRRLSAGFFNLPRELRDEIYKYHFANFKPFLDVVSEITLTPLQRLIPDGTDISPRQFKGYTKIFCTSRQVHEEATEMFYTYIYPKLRLTFAKQKDFWGFRGIQSAHPSFKTASAEFTARYSLIWVEPWKGRISIIIEGILHIIRKDVKLKGWLVENEMDDKDNMLFHLAWRNRRKGDMANHGRFHVLEGPGRKVTVEWDNNWASAQPEKTFRFTGDVGYFNALFKVPKEVSLDDLFIV